jgi:8-hydroxy-5-deazaflavin:NADPH oxidoreductase
VTASRQIGVELATELKQTRRTHAMSYAIVGSGSVGTALAAQFARRGIEVAIANTRGPESLVALVNSLGPAVRPVALNEALEAAIIIFAVPFASHEAVARTRTDWGGKTVIDAMNYRNLNLDPIGRLQSSDFVANALPGAKVVKTFNQLPAALLAREPNEAAGRRVMFVAGNHEDANAEVASLVSALGFAPIVLGRIDQGGRLLRYRGPLVLQNLIMLDV